LCVSYDDAFSFSFAGEFEEVEDLEIGVFFFVDADSLDGDQVVGVVAEAVPAFFAGVEELDVVG
jgi:hypothetical protein